MRRNTLLYGIASMINDMSSEIVKSIIPAVVSSPVLAGMAGGMVEGLAEAFKFFFGRMSDLLEKRKAFILSGYVISSVSRVAMAAFPFLLPFLIFFDRIGKSIRDSPRDASIAETERNVFLGFSFRRMMDNIGAVAGVLLALLLYPILGTSILWVAAGIGLLSFIPIIFSSETFRKSKKRLPKNLRKPIILALPYLGNASYVFFAFSYPSLSPVLIYAVFNLSYAFLVMPFSFEKLIGRKNVLGLGYALFPLSLFLAAMSFNPFVSAVVFGLGYGLVKTSSLEMAGKSASEIGMFQSLSGILTIISNILIGMGWQFIGKASLVVAGIVFLSLGFLAFSKA